MSLSAKMRRAPLRAVTGAFILSSGLGKLKADAATAEQVHGMATGTYPFLGKVNPKAFTTGLAAGELAVGAVVLAPFVSPVIAGAAVAGFSGALLNVYWQTPGMHEPGDPRPTQQGTPMAKDVWMFGIGTGLIIDGLLEPAHDKKLEVTAHLSEKKAAKGRQARKARKRAARANSELLSQARDTALALESSTRKRGKKAAKKAQKKADKATKRLAKARDNYGPAAADKAADAGKTVRGWVEEYGPVVADKARDTAKQARGAAKDLVDEYGPTVADKAKQARDTAKDLADEYGPVVADKARDTAKQARGAAKDLVDEYGPTVADKAKQARDAAKDLVDEYGPTVADKAKQARDAAKDLADEYGPVVADKARDTAKQARGVAKDAADRAQAAVR